MWKTASLEPSVPWTKIREDSKQVSTGFTPFLGVLSVSEAWFRSPQSWSRLSSDVRLAWQVPWDTEEKGRRRKVTTDLGGLEPPNFAAPANHGWGNDATLTGQQVLLVAAV